MELTLFHVSPYFEAPHFYTLIFVVVASLFLAKPEVSGAWWLKATFIAVLAHLGVLWYSYGYGYGSMWRLDEATIYVPSIFLGIYIFRQAELKGLAAVFSRWLFVAWVFVLLSQTLLLYSSFRTEHGGELVINRAFENPGYEVFIASVALYLTFLFPKAILGVRYLQIFLVCQIFISYLSAVLTFGRTMFSEPFLLQAYSALGLIEYNFFRAFAVPLFLLHMFLMVNTLKLSSFKEVVRCYVSLKGRLNRSSLWLLSFAVTYINVAVWTYLDKLRYSDIEFIGLRLGLILFVVLSGLLVALNLWIHVALVLKRLHDLGRTAKVFWFYLIPVIGQLGVLIYAGFFPGIKAEIENLERTV